MFLSRPAPRKAIKKKVAPPSLKIDLNVVQKPPDINIKPKNTSPSQLLHSNSSNTTIESFRGVFSKLTESIYMGDCICAQNKEELLNLGITHIINCAGMKINNFFPDTFIYKKIELYDNPAEEIYSLFYEVIDFIQNAVQFSGKVFIHCNYGVSRSAVMAICYFIYANDWSYETALKFVKQARSICEPNAGFVFSLITWDNHRKNSFAPIRAYSVVPLSECSTNLIAKYIQSPSSISFDNYSCYIIQTPRILYIWMGSQSTLDKVDAAVNFTELLQRYEKAVGTIQMILQDKEPDHFRSLFSSI